MRQCPTTDGAGGNVKSRTGYGGLPLMKLLLKKLRSPWLLMVLTFHGTGLCLCGGADADEYDQALELLNRAHGEYRVTRRADVARAKAQLEEQAKLLGAIFDASDQYGQAWKAYLLWDRLSAQLAQDADANLTELSAILDRMTRDYDGLGDARRLAGPRRACAVLLSMPQL